MALGRALTIQPTVLLLDEPFGAPDAAAHRDQRIWLGGLHEDTGSTTTLVTHDQEEAFELADRVVVMGEGRIEQIGSADQIHDRPANPFTARFMCASIELPVVLQAGRAQAPGLDASRLPRRALSADGTAALFLRPDAPDPQGGWKVKRLTSNGAILRLEIRSGGTRIPVDLPRRAPEARAISQGIRALLRPEAGAIFPDPRRATPSPAPPNSPAGRKPCDDPQAANRRAGAAFGRCPRLRAGQDPERQP